METRKQEEYNPNVVRLDARAEYYAQEIDLGNSGFRALCQDLLTRLQRPSSVEIKIIVPHKFALLSAMMSDDVRPQSISRLMSARAKVQLAELAAGDRAVEWICACMINAGLITDASEAVAVQEVLTSDYHKFLTVRSELDYWLIDHVSPEIADLFFTDIGWVEVIDDQISGRSKRSVQQTADDLDAIADKIELVVRNSITHYIANTIGINGSSYDGFSGRIITGGLINHV